VVLDRIAKSVIDGCRGEHSEFVFTRAGKPIARMNNSGWKAARRRASKRCASELGRSCPKGFRSIRVHDLKHTTDIGCEPLASGLRIANYSWVTRPVTSPRTTRHPKLRH